MSPSSAGAVGPVAGAARSSSGHQPRRRLGRRLRRDPGDVASWSTRPPDHRGRPRRHRRAGRRHRDHPGRRRPSAVTPSTDTFTYVPPRPSPGSPRTANPAGGPTGGGTQVTIAGTSFDGVTAVTFGTTPATSFLVNCLTSITAVAPAGTGTVDVTVTTGAGHRPTTVGRPVRLQPDAGRRTDGTASYSNSPGHRRPGHGHQPVRLDRDHRPPSARGRPDQKVGLSGLHQRPHRRHVHRRRRGAPAASPSPSPRPSPAGHRSRPVLATVTPTTVTATTSRAARSPSTAVGPGSPASRST